MERLPTPLPEGAAQHESLDDFRIGDPYEILALLRQMAEMRTVLTIATPGGVSYTTTVWEVDRTRKLVRFAADRVDDHLRRVLDAHDAVAFGYLDGVKVQFEVGRLVHAQSRGDEKVLDASLPLEVFRFQRRSSFRVRPILGAAPTVRMQHPAVPDTTVELRVLDVSVGGIALLLPREHAVPRPGALVQQALVNLDGDTRFTASVRIVHVTAVDQDAQGVRLGCEFVGLPAESLRALQRYVDVTQRLRRQLSLDRPD
ncbi:MAG TPA: flagellar regulator YcgR PilZN domain-containing protein [Burkholderiaceae bacterium]|nr:flagellar regulator YcgR PilZN domain-containing protein [Burkholderiaceae bacterium]